MRILFISGREGTYTRNAVIIKGLKQNNVEVIECTSSGKSYPARYVESVYKLLKNRNEQYDAIFVGFFGQPLIPLVTRLSKKPIIFDAFISAYDTLCFDRQKINPNSFGGKALYGLDKKSCELADIVITDTQAHANYFVETFDLEKDKFHRIFVGADESVFYPRRSDSDSEGKFKVFYYGTYLPLHGIEYIIGAAKLLEEYTQVEFEIIGHGIEYEKIMKLAHIYKLKNTTFKKWIPYQELPLAIANADICLGGHFSAIDKAKRVISGKTFQFIAMEKPIIVGDNPANRELFVDKQNALFVEHENSEDLAGAILELNRNITLKESLRREGHLLFNRQCSSITIGKKIKTIISDNLRGDTY